MRTGNIILVPFPYAELTKKKPRPAVVIAQTRDKYKDIIVAAISSVVPKKTTENEIIIEATRKNKLRTRSIIKVDRIVTLKREDIIARLGNLSKDELEVFKEKFRNLID